MGLEAYVCCNCFKTGKSTPPPFEELVVIGDHGGPELVVADPLSEEEHEKQDELYDRFGEWLHDCCMHSDGDYASESVANWGGYRLFLQALGDVGWEYFPVLSEWLPEGNGGMLPASKAEQTLRELHFFQERIKLATNTFLLDSDTGEVIHEYVRAYNGVFLRGGASGVDAGIDTEGFFIRASADAAEEPQEYFRSKQFSQTLLESREVVGSCTEKALFCDLISNREYLSPVGVQSKRISGSDGIIQNDRGAMPCEYPRNMHTEQRRLDEGHFVYITHPLDILFNASISTGNPVVWC